MKQKDKYRYFRERTLRWVNYFGLKDWDIRTLHEKLPKHIAAQVTRNPNSRLATMVINKHPVKHDGNSEKIEICTSAFHETLHVMFADIADAAAKAIGRKRTGNLEESIIRRLENTIYKDLLDYRYLLIEKEAQDKRIEQLEKKLKKATKG